MLLQLVLTFCLFSDPPPDSPIPPPEVYQTDLLRFPNAENSKASLGFGKIHRNWVHKQFYTPPWPVAQDEFWLAWERECDRRICIWQLLVDIHECKTDEQRLGCLLELKRNLGPDMYAAGCLPNIIPLEKFKEMEEQGIARRTPRSP